MEFAISKAVSELEDDEDEGQSFIERQRVLFKQNFGKFVVAVLEAALKKEDDNLKETCREVLKAYKGELSPVVFGEFAAKLI